MSESDLIGTQSSSLNVLIYGAGWPS